YRGRDVPIEGRELRLIFGMADGIEEARVEHRKRDFDRNGSHAECLEQQDLVLDQREAGWLQKARAVIAVRIGQLARELHRKLRAGPDGVDASLKIGDIAIELTGEILVDAGDLSEAAASAGQLDDDDDRCARQPFP